MIAIYSLGPIRRQRKIQGDPNLLPSERTIPHCYTTPSSPSLPLSQKDDDKGDVPSINAPNIRYYQA